MRKATRVFSVNPDTIPSIEAAYDEFMNLAEAHFREHPFLLGGRPTIGDYALFGPLFAHLGRDPKPLALMQKRAPALFQWLERMNTPAGIKNHLMVASEGKLFAEDALPNANITPWPDITTGTANGWRPTILIISHSYVRTGAAHWD